MKVIRFVCIKFDIYVFIGEILFSLF